MTALTVAALARSGGVGVETVRYYQRRGLLSTPERPPSGGARVYGDADVGRLQFIRSAQTAGFTLEEIGALLRLDAVSDRARIRAMASERLAGLKAKIEELVAARSVLQQLVRDCDEAGKGPCPIVMAFNSNVATSAGAEGMAGAMDDGPGRDHGVSLAAPAKAQRPSARKSRVGRH